MKEQIVSLSGGKDSTALLLMMLERGMKVDEAVFFDTGMEFPQMYEHLDKVEDYTGMKITRLEFPQSFDYFMLDYEKKKGKRKGTHGYGWPTPRARWCTRIKTDTIKAYLRGRDVEQYIGIAADEAERCKSYNYPLVEWGVTEADALAYCKERGFTWGGSLRPFLPCVVLVLPAAIHQGASHAQGLLPRIVAKAHRHGHTCEPTVRGDATTQVQA